MRNFKTKFSPLALLLVSITFMLSVPLNAGAADLKEGERYTLTVLHTNDIHGHVDKLPKFATVINETKNNTGLNVLVLDGGDIFLRGEFQEFQGIPEIRMMNAMGYDAMVCGNNDFRVPPAGGTPSDGNNQLKALSETAQFPLLCANVKMKDSGQYSEFVKPFIVKEVRGVKIGIIGVTSMKPQDRDWTEVSDKVFERGDITLNNLINTVISEADVIIVLSHAGLIVDTYMAGTNGVSAIIGADDHIVMPEPIYYATGYGETGTPIVQNGGEFEHYLGRIDLTFEKTGNAMKLVEYSRCLYSMEDVNEDVEVMSIIAEYRSEDSEPCPLPETGCDIGFPVLAIVIVALFSGAVLFRRKKSLS
ncbi:MAG: metallophosphatase [Synergistaceae bacterium]|nr:metallophosphatase [Synergistaceae bacterium]